MALFAGLIFDILGSNVAGKTTLNRILATLTRPSGGKAENDGYDVMRYPLEAKQKIGVVHQSLNTDPELTARESMRIHGLLFGLVAFVIAVRVVRLSKS